MKLSFSPLSRTKAAGLALFAALATAVAAAAAPSASPSSAAATSAPSAASSATPSAAPGPAEAAPASSATAAAEPVALSITDWIPPEEKSDRPKPMEWAKATTLELFRSHPRCSASALREWVRISCTGTDSQLMGVRPLGGSDEGVHIADFEAKGEGGELENGLHIILPVRRGDRRLLSINRWDSGGWKSFYIVEDTELVISELWLPGDRGPTITVH